MDHFIDVRALADPEIGASQVLNVTANKLHAALVALRANDIGVSFPGFRLNPVGLGNTLRLHGRKERLAELVATGFLHSVKDYVRVSEIDPVPTGAVYRVVRRVQVDSNVEKIRRRQMRRHGWTEEEARERIPDSVERRLLLPYLRMRSSSTGQPFRLFIEHQECRPAPASGEFNTYGLSTTATIPWF
jgi:CRISPR-associated endonuclease Csy4